MCKMYIVLKFASPINNQEKFKYVLQLINMMHPSAPMLFKETLSNIFVLETQGVPLDEIVKNVGDYKTVFGITEPFMSQVFIDGLPRGSSGKIPNANLRNLSPEQIKNLTAIRNNSKSGNTYDPGKLTLNQAIQLSYIGIWKKMNLDAISKYPDTTRALFDMAFNMGDVTTVKLLQRTINSKAQKILINLNSNQRENGVVGLVNQINDAYVLPKNFYQKNGIYLFKPLTVDGALIINGETEALLKYLIDGKFITDAQLALSLTNQRVKYYNSHTSPRFLKGLKNRAHVFYEYLSPRVNNPTLTEQQKQWRKSNPGFARIQTHSGE